MARRPWNAAATLLLAEAVLVCSASAQQSSGPGENTVAGAAIDLAASLPDAPRPRASAGGSDGAMVMTANLTAPGNWQFSPESQQSPGFPPVSRAPRTQRSGSRKEHPGIPSLPADCLPDTSQPAPVRMSCAPFSNPFQRFVASTAPHPLTVRQKGLLAIRNVTDPFNFLTIGAESAISVASDARSPYGPGLAGFGRNFGVAYTETVVSSFFGTFLIPSLVHQDPHYHRMPNATIQRRVLHAATEVVWGQSDSGLGMVNYATIGNTAIGDALGNLYVPGRQKSWSAGVSRFATALASDPIDNLITEFLPDVARHVNVQIVLVQRVVNSVERQNGGT